MENFMHYTSFTNIFREGISDAFRVPKNNLRISFMKLSTINIFFVVRNN
jgi:hypothetical protein